jgi:hypothetical protein
MYMKPQQFTPFSLSRWIFDSFWGWLLGIIVILVLSSLLDSIGIENLQFYVGIGVITGMSLAQYRHIRRYFHFNISWMIWSILSFSMPFVLIDGIKHYGLYSFSQNPLMLCVILATFTVSLTQYFLLKKSMPYPWSWCIFSIIGWLLAGIATLALEYTPSLTHNNMIVFIINVILILSGGIFIGIFTGLAARKILTTTDNNTFDKF